MTTVSKLELRASRKRRIRARVTGSAARPRLAVFRSNVATYAQLIDDTAGVTIVAASDIHAKGSTKVARAKDIGMKIAEAAKAKGVTAVVFDRGGYAYHGRVKAVADGAREAGLSF